MIATVPVACPQCHEVAVSVTLERLYGRNHVEVADQDCACDLTSDDVDVMYEEALEVAG